MNTNTTTRPASATSKVPDVRQVPLPVLAGACTLGQKPLFVKVDGVPVAAFNASL